MLNKIAFLGIE